MRFNGKTVAAVDIEAGAKTPHGKELLQVYAPFLGIHQALWHGQPLQAANEDKRLSVSSVWCSTN